MLEIPRTERTTIQYLGSQTPRFTDQTVCEVEVIQKEQQRIVGQLTLGIIHDFNNLMTAVIGNSQLALRQQNPDRTDRLLNEILQASKRASNLSNHILTFSKGGQIEKSSMDINDPIVETFHLIKRTFSNKINITISLSSQLPRFFGSETQIQQIILNLCLNSRDALPSIGGRIEIETALAMSESHGEFIRISVFDNGCGIEPEKRDYIFDEFFTTKETGNGLGLSNIFKIVESYRGFIDFNSEPFKRTAFHIFLPTHGACEYISDAAAK